MGTSFRTLPRFSKPVQQVAAVCYRRKGSSIEFLLINTDRGKWTFPKGSLNPALSIRQVAAQEALEEAGAKGTIDHQHFDCYLHAKRALWKSRQGHEFAVEAYLLEVVKTTEPLEPHRRPTWFTPEKAKRKLAKSRKRKYRRELERVVDRAVATLNRRWDRN